MTEAWVVIQNVKIDEPVYSGPTAPTGQIVGIETAHKIVAALEAAGYLIEWHPKTTLGLNAYD